MTMAQNNNQGFLQLNGGQPPNHKITLAEGYTYTLTEKSAPPVQSESAAFCLSWGEGVGYTVVGCIGEWTKSKLANSLHHCGQCLRYLYVHLDIVACSGSQPS